MRKLVLLHIFCLQERIQQCSSSGNTCQTLDIWDHRKLMAIEVYLTSWFLKVCVNHQSYILYCLLSLEFLLYMNDTGYSQLCFVTLSDFTYHPHLCIIYVWLVIHLIVCTHQMWKVQCQVYRKIYLGFIAILLFFTSAYLLFVVE